VSDVRYVLEYKEPGDSYWHVVGWLRELYTGQENPSEYGFRSLEVARSTRESEQSKRPWLQIRIVKETREVLDL